MVNRRILLTVVCLCAWFVSISAAQSTDTQHSSEEQSSSPGQSDTSKPTTETNEAPPEEETKPAPSPLSPITSVKEFGTGSNSPGSNYIVPAAQYSGFADTNPDIAPGQSKLDMISAYAGSLTFQQVRNHSALSLNYAAGILLFGERPPTAPSASSSPDPTAIVQGAGVIETINWRRWKLLLDDNLLLLPESSVGFLGFSGLQQSSIQAFGTNNLYGESGLSPLFLPNQTILAGHAERLSNTGAVEAEYSAGPRSTITATGVYGQLDYLESGYINSSYFTFLTGYNYQLGPLTEVGISYFDTLIKFQASSQEMLNRGVLFAYGRQLKARLSLQLTAGPMLNQATIPTTGGATTKGFFATFDSLKYRTRKTGLDLAYLRFTTAGSGVLHGDEENVGRLTASRRISRDYDVAFDFAHGYNESFIQESATARRTKFELWQGGVNFSRRLGERWRFYTVYQIQLQRSNQSVCVSDICGQTILRHFGTVGLSWRAKSIPLE